MEPIRTARFERKASSVAEIPDSAAFHAQEAFRVQKVIELPQAQYRYFCQHLLEDMPFIAENRLLCGVDEQRRTKCLMITTPQSASCILTNCEGYGYARYAAYVSDKSLVDVDGVPVEHRDQQEPGTDEKSTAHKGRSPGQGR